MLLTVVLLCQGVLVGVSAERPQRENDEWQSMADEEEVYLWKPAVIDEGEQPEPLETPEAETLIDSVDEEETEEEETEEANTENVDNANNTTPPVTEGGDGNLSPAEETKQEGGDEDENNNEGGNEVPGKTETEKPADPSVTITIIPQKEPEIPEAGQEDGQTQNVKKKKPDGFYVEYLVNKKNTEVTVKATADEAFSISSNDGGWKGISDQEYQKVYSQNTSENIIVYFGENQSASVTVFVVDVRETKGNNQDQTISDATAKAAISENADTQQMTATGLSLAMDDEPVELLNIGDRTRGFISQDPIYITDSSFSDENISSVIFSHNNKDGTDTSDKIGNGGFTVYYTAEGIQGRQEKKFEGSDNTKEIEVNGQKYIICRPGYNPSGGADTDDIPPKATIAYNPSSAPANKTTATLTATEPVMLSDDNWIAVGPVDDGYSDVWERIYTENCQYPIKLVDEAGNEGTTEVFIDWLDNIQPTATVAYSTKDLTPGTVTVTLTADEPLQQVEDGWTVVSGTDNKVWEKVYDKNFIGEVTFKDLAGNDGSTVVSIKNILPGYNVRWNTNSTNGTVIVYISANDGYTFEVVGWGSMNTGNGYSKKYFKNTDTTATIIYEGETYTVNINIENIIEPAIINETRSNSTTLTDTVTVTLTANEPIQKLGEGWTSVGGETLSTQWQKVYDKNVVDEVISFVDSNNNPGNYMLSVRNIMPTLTITQSITELTNKNVYVYVTSDVDFDIVPGSNGWEKLGEGRWRIKFGGNGTKKAVISYNGLLSAEIPITVTNIDKVAPQAQIAYTPDNGAFTNKPVTVTLTSDKPLKAINGWTKVNDTTYTLVYQDNVADQVEIEDMAGNKVTVPYVITWIDVTAPVISGILDSKAYTGSVGYSVSDNNFVTEVIIDGVSYSEVNAPKTISQVGAHTLTALDEAGNSTTVKFVIVATAPPSSGGATTGGGGTTTTTRRTGTGNYTALTTIEDDETPLGAGSVLLLNRNGVTLESYPNNVDDATGIILINTALKDTFFCYEFNLVEMRMLSRVYPKGYYAIKAEGLDVQVPYSMYNGFPEFNALLNQQGGTTDSYKMRITFNGDGDATTTALQANHPTVLAGSPLWNVSHTFHDEYGSQADVKITQITSPAMFHFDASANRTEYLVMDAQSNELTLEKLEHEGQTAIVEITKDAVYGVAADEGTSTLGKR